MATRPNPMAERVRTVLVETDEDELTEVSMFGGIGFMVRGNLACAASPRGLLVRVGDDRDSLLELPDVEPSIMGKREMKNWLHVSIAEMDDDELRDWVDRGLNCSVTSDEGLTNVASVIWLSAA